MGEFYFGNNLKYLRELEGLKQHEMHGAIGFKQSTWNGYEKETSSPNLKDLIEISDYFGIAESDLLHINISDSDLNTLYYNYIRSQKQPFFLGNTPRAKTFTEFINGPYQVIAPHLKGGFVPGNVPFPVPFDPKKKSKGVSYTQQKGPLNTVEMNEPPGKYNTKRNLTDSERIAELERVLGGIKAILTTWNS